MANLVKSLSDWLYHMHRYKRNWAISFNKKRPQPLALCWCSLDRGREVVMDMKMTVTTEASLTQHGLCSPTCLFVEALFEVPGIGLRLNSTKFWLLHAVFSPATLLDRYWIQIPK